MMLPGVELARRRRLHYHRDVASPSAGAAEHPHHHHHHYAHAHHAAPTGVAGPALAARIRLEEKLRGAALPPASTSRWGRLMRDGVGRSSPRHPHHQITGRQDDDVLQATPWRPPRLPDPAALLLQQAAAAADDGVPRRQRRAELTRTLSKVDVCAVCLDEVRPEPEPEEPERAVTRLPCSHKYHSECVLPWLAVHPDCPCCRALVPSADTLVHQV